MKKTIIIFAQWLAGNLSRLTAWLNRLGRVEGPKSQFVDLAPRDDADQGGVYSTALRYATNNDRVCNIALTGPYGSGKSSIIQTFLKTYPRRALHISLASFVPETNTPESNAPESNAPESSAVPKKNEHKVSRQEIERSILQQMLYGADANKLPLSRFKRIQSPGQIKSILVSAYLLLSLLVSWYVFEQRKEIFYGPLTEFLVLSNWLNIGEVSIALLFFGVVLHKLYVASFGVSLKSVSLKDIEMRPSSEDKESILNRHLDEIIYFFQSTKYDLVVIEDLDRFENPDIFVTLREINSLINENAGVKRKHKIKFIYALRDNMFASTERTKFFEFIIPVIPIINTSNSVQKVLEEAERLKINDQINPQFLRDVSRYLNDLRLIRNIFNEYAIYLDKLKINDEHVLDANKLLAILIYKNVCPSDFERLHRGEGNLHDVLNCKDELIKPGEANYRSEIAGLENQLEVSERQTPKDLKELRQIYAMAFVESFPVKAHNVSIDQHTWIEIPKLVEHDTFEQLIGTSQVFHKILNGYQSQVLSTIFQDASSSLKSYQQRKSQIEAKMVENKSKSHSQIHDLRSKIAKLRTTKLNELLRLESNGQDNRFKGFVENGELARFLILEGRLDDTYYQYTSLFHSGRLSPNDNKFLIKIRAFSAPEPDFQIDNPIEIIREMRDEDFGQSYVLNVKIIDCLLINQSTYHDQTRKLFEFLSSKFESCEEFFDAYYANGCEVERLLLGLNSAWKGFVPAAIGSSKNISHIAQLISSLPEATLKQLIKDFHELPKFVSENLPDILANMPELKLESKIERLKWIDFEVRDFTAIKDHSEAVGFMFNEGLFELTVENLEYAYRENLGKNDLVPLRESNFTTLRSIDSKILLDRIERDFDVYLSQVLLELEGNTKEDVHAILDIVSRVKELNQDNLYVFLERQSTRLPNLEGVPEELHAMLFQLSMIEPTWLNCLDFMKGDGFDADTFIGYIERDDVRTAILGSSIPSDGDSYKLRHFLVNAGSLSDAAYREYIHALPKQFRDFPEDLAASKLNILIDEAKITFAYDSIKALEDRDLQVKFVSANIDIYLADPDSFLLDDDFREEILRSNIDQLAKCKVIELMDLDALADIKERSVLIGQIVSANDAYSFNLNGEIVKSFMGNIQSCATRILILNRYHELLSETEVREVLSILPSPFSEIKFGNKRPKLSNNFANINLVKWLKSRKIISSWKLDGRNNDYIKVHLFKGS